VAGWALLSISHNTRDIQRPWWFQRFFRVADQARIERLSICLIKVGFLNTIIPPYSSLQACLLKDRFPLRRELKRLQQKERAGQPVGQLVEAFQRRLKTSTQLTELRQSKTPVPKFANELPINGLREEIASLIENNQVIILCGETGSGKSTQLPQICLTLGLGVYGRIAHTQPRRLAARALASRISNELGREMGTTVGYKVRFQDRVKPETQVKLLTDGMLLAEIQQDRFLNEYDTIIIDEAHERSLNIDFILGYLRELLPKRPELKLIVTSATIDPERFSKQFSGAPILNVSGRTYPVEVLYRQPEEEGGGERDLPIQQAIVDAVHELSRVDRGDILIFLSGEREIREIAEVLHKSRLDSTEVLPLYARLGSNEQRRIFAPGGLRRIILATNVAETSLTVPGIRYVIDAGFARISRYSHRSKIQRLPVERISQASAEQRKGRCGRVAAGICIRLYSEEDFLSRPEFTEPEILRTNLASVILQMKILGFGEIGQFPFVDMPDSRLIKDGYRVLEEIGAVDRDRRVTAIGRRLVKLPVDPRVGRMLFTAAHTHCLCELLIIAAALGVQDPRERPLEKQQAADEAHREFRHEQSDFMTFINLWDHLETQRKHLSKRKFQAYCRGRYLSWNRVQEWHDIHHQLRGQMHEMGFKDNTSEADYETIHKAILTGLLSNIGFKSGAKGHEYLGARNSRFNIFPGSGLFKNQPKWLIAAELVETSKLYARTVAQVKPEWIESVSGHLVSHSYSEPHWEKKRGQVAAFQKVTLFGLHLVPKRKINYGAIDPVESREIFIHAALVGRDFHTKAPFWRHNGDLISDVEAMEHKSRRRDILVNDLTIFDYYAKQVPEGIYSTAAFERWMRKSSQKNPKLLHMRLDDLIATEESLDLETQYPDTLSMEGIQLPLLYHFDPGQKVDGLTLKIPQAILNQIPESRCQWLVPGLLRERVIALLKSLPKSLRRSFVPVPDYADAFLKVQEPSSHPLTQILSEFLKKKTGVYIPEDAWQEEQIPDHLRMRYQVMDGKGQLLEESRDLHQLKQTYGQDEVHQYQKFSGVGIEKEGIKDWDFDPLPETVEMKQGGIVLKGYPALVDCQDSVSIQVLDSSLNAQLTHAVGLRRLYMLKLGKEMRYLRRNMSGLEKVQLSYANVPEVGDIRAPRRDNRRLEDSLVALIVDRTFINEQPPVNCSEAFVKRIVERKGDLMNTANEVLNVTRSIFDEYQPLRKKLYAANQINWLNALGDMKQQLTQLVYQGFLEQVPFSHLQQYPRYLRAMAIRLDKLGRALARDQENHRLMQPLYQQWQQRSERYTEQGRTDVRLEEIRWAFEELRVSLFAQELKTVFPVSVKRIDRRWKELGL